jgi:regulator of sigma E protease
MCGVKVEEFALGFGKKLWCFSDKNNTEWQIRLIPIGGYVKMFGDESPDSRPNVDLINSMTDEEKKVSFLHKKIWQKFLIIFAGPLFNFLFSIMILTLIFSLFGQLKVLTVVDGIVDNSIAQEIGMQVGDRIIEINDKKVTYFSDVMKKVSLNTGNVMNIKVKRDIGNGDYRYINFNVIPKLVETTEFGHKTSVRRLGVIAHTSEFKKLSILSSITTSIKEVYDICVINFLGMKQIAFGERSVKELSGPVKIANIAGKTARQGIGSAISFVVFLSCSLGFINLLPVPVLDGGHLFCYIIAIFNRGKELSVKTQNFIMKLGFVFIIAIFLITTFNDIKDILFISH